MLRVFFSRRALAAWYRTRSVTLRLVTPPPVSHARQASISTHIAREYYTEWRGWHEHVPLFVERVGSHPDRLHAMCAERRIIHIFHARRGSSTAARTGRVLAVTDSEASRAASAPP
jgi:hypothetical protein